MPALRSKEWAFVVFDLDNFSWINKENGKYHAIITAPPNPAKFVVGQLEICPHTGRAHFQGYVEFPDLVTLRKLKSLSRVFGSACGTINFTICDGSRTKNVRYCNKPDTKHPDGVVIAPLALEGDVDETEDREAVKAARRGTGRDEPRKPEKVSDAEVFMFLDEYVAECESNGKMIGDPYVLATQMTREFKTLDADDDDTRKRKAMIGKVLTKLQVRDTFIGKWLVSARQQRKREREEQSGTVEVRNVSVEYIYGPTGTGKTMYALTSYPNLYIKADATKWWPGYNGQTEILLDDMKGVKSGADGYYTTDVLQQILQGLPLMLEVKGGHVQSNWNHVVITSNYEFDEQFDCWSQISQAVKQSIRSRITKITKLDGEDKRALDPPPEYPKVIRTVKKI